MRIINKKCLLIILLAGVIITGAVIFKPKEEVKLDNVILKQEVNNKTFAMYKETNSGYEEYKETKFPDMYVLNIEKSKCIDNNGNELEDVLSYENDKVTITSGNTTYCYLYFDKSLGLEIKEKNPSGLKSEKVRGAMFRFQGQYNEDVQNYICFGTSDKEECVTDTDHHMYRIIGIEAETGRVKVIKKEALNKLYKWAENYTDDVKLSESIFFNAINGEDFLENEEYIPKDWKEKITNNIWHYGDILENDQTGTMQSIPILYEIETGQRETKWFIKENNTEMQGKWDDIIESKVSLIYLHDYSYSVSDESKCNSWYGGVEEYTKCKTGWMHISQNDSEFYDKEDLTMDRYGWNYGRGGFDCFAISSSGFSGFWNFTSNRIARPVFYIDASQTLKDGIGTIDNPFIIA